MFRDFLMLLRRYTASSVLNIVGMALAFASAYLILVQVNFDMSYNRKITNAENIYRPCGIVTIQVSYAKEFRKS